MGRGVLIQITPQMRILVAIEAIDGRKGIDAIAQLCREKLDADPFSGCLFIFRSRSGTAIRILQYDGQGFWLATKRLSKGRFKWWPTGNEPARTLRAHQAQLLLAAGNPETEAAPVWRHVSCEQQESRQKACVPISVLAYCGYAGNGNLALSGQAIDREEIVFIREFIPEHPHSSRRKLSRKLCEAWSGNRPTARCATWFAAACC